MQARKGFILTLFAVSIALLLLVTSVYLIQIGIVVVKEEARMTEEEQGSLYPIAWSTTNLVLQSLKGAFDGSDPAAGDVMKVFLGSDVLSGQINPAEAPFTVDVGPVGKPFVVSCSVKVSGDIGSVINVATTANADRYGKYTVRGALSKDKDLSGADDWKIIWR
jgi:hypothetical protein